MKEFNVESKFADKNGEIIILEISGFIDQTNSGKLQKVFDNVLKAENSKVVVDFNNLDYMSSAGWGVFVGEIKRFRSNGGDIKLCNMNPDIYDVFYMLEFYHILEDYKSVKEASLAFEEIGDELDLVSDDANEGSLPESIVVEEDASEEIEFDVSETIMTDASHDPAKYSQTFESFDSVKDINLQKLPLHEKVKHVIAENPILNIFGIQKVLKHEEFGSETISVFRLWLLLKELDLNNKTKRFRYYRSC